MSLRDVIARPGFKTGDYTVTRRAASSDDGKGRVSQGSTSTFSIVASIQPYRGRTLMVNGEGRRNEDVRVVFTTTELRATPAAPDTVSIGGEVFAVFTSEPWLAFGGTHYRAYVARQAIP